MNITGINIHQHEMESIHQAYSMLNTDTVKKILNALPMTTRELSKHLNLNEKNVGYLLRRMVRLQLVTKGTKGYEENSGRIRRFVFFADYLETTLQSSSTAYTTALILKNPLKLELLNQIANNEGIYQAKLIGDRDRTTVSKALKKLVEIKAVNTKKKGKAKILTVNKDLLRHIIRLYLE